MATSKLTLTSTLPLPKTSLTIPRLGFGVYRSPQSICIQSCTTALKAGYRHFDSAQFYQNESQVGQAVADSSFERSELFLTTKILSPGRNFEETYRSIVGSVEKMGSPAAEKAGRDNAKAYVDLFLIHSPGGNAEARKMMWQALEKAHGEGLVKTIGVSNYGKGHLEEMKKYASVWPPHVNQIELHPWCQQREAVEYCEQQGIVIEAYCPLVRNAKADDKTLNSIAKKHSKSTGQVLIRWSLQKNFVPLPKSDTPSRIESNADVYGFELDADDMKALDGLDQGSKGALVRGV